MNEGKAGNGSEGNQVVLEDTYGKVPYLPLDRGTIRIFPYSQSFGSFLNHTFSIDTAVSESAMLGSTVDQCSVPKRRVGALMEHIRLVETSAHPFVDAYLCGLIGLFETVFPDRIRAYYLIGSFATGGAIASSDVDLRVIFKDQFAEHEVARIERFRENCRAISALPLDIPIQCEADFQHGQADPIALKTAALWLYGTDIRTQLPMPPINDYLRMVTGAPYRNMALRLRKQEMVIYPLRYPDPGGEFYGYDVAGKMQHFVVTIGWAATCAIVLSTRQYVAKKRDWLALYQQHINDEWVAWLTAVWEGCRNRWAYAIPTDDRQRTELRTLCRDALGFENHYLRRYRAYLLGELTGADPASQLVALERLRQIVYHDAEVRGAVTERAESSHPVVRQAAHQTLGIMQQTAP